MVSVETYPGTLRPFNSFLILLNLEKDHSPEPRQGRNQLTRTYETRPTTCFIAWFTPSNRHDSPNAGRSQCALSTTAL